MIKRPSNSRLVIVIIAFLLTNLSITEAHSQTDPGIQRKYKKIDSLNELSRNYAFVDNIKALRFANEALEYSLSLDYKKGEAFAFRNMSSVYVAQFSFAESLEFINKALEIFEELDDEEGVANCYISLGHTFSRLGQDSVAYEYHRKAFDFFEKGENMDRLAITSHNLGLALMALNDMEAAKVYFNKALNLGQNLKNHQLESSCLSYLGQIAYESDNLIVAEELFNESLDLFEALGSEAHKEATIIALYHLAMIQKANGQFEIMISNLITASKVISDYDAGFFVNEVYEELISYYRTRGEFKMVVYYTSQFAEVLKDFNQKKLKESTSSYLSFAKSRELEKRYVDGIKNNELNEEIVKANSKTIKVLIITSIGLGIFLFVIIYQFFRNKRNTDSILSIYRNAGTALVLVDENGGILRWNRFSEELFGEKSESMVGKNFFTEFISKETKILPSEIEKAFLEEYSVITVDGRAKEISVNCSRTFINHKLFFVLFINDISDYKRLQRSNDFYKVILEKSNEISKIGIWEINYSGFLNHEMPVISSKILQILELDEVDPDRLNSINWPNFFKSEESKSRLKKIFHEATENKEPFDIELELISFKGNSIWIRLIGNVEYISKNDFKLYGTAQDITEFKYGILQIEESLNREQELNKLKSKFISMASHEFRTPLATISTSVELIQLNLAKLHSNSTNTFDKHTKSIFNQIDRLEKTLDGILMLEKVIQGKIEVNGCQVDLKEILNGIIEDVNIAGDNRKPVLSIQEGIFILNTDPDILHHILQNLISNALKYSPGMKDPIIKMDNGKESIIVEIQDFGIGIPEEEKHGLFQSFFRAKNTSGIKGTGLGLSIVKEFVSLLKAEISIDSKEGEGTKVTLILPLNA